MIRVGVGVVLAMSLGGVALAQGTGAANVTDNPNNSVVQPGVAKPPANAPQPANVKPQPNGSSAVWANQPTLPQVALHPQATVGSTTPVAGPGGTTKARVGQ